MRAPGSAEDCGIVHPFRIASSPRKRSTELIPTAASTCARLQTVSHGW
jgi:hypothetical protein